MSHPRARSVTDWYRDGKVTIDLFLEAAERQIKDGAPISEDEFYEVMNLCKQLVDVGARRRDLAGLDG